MAQALIFLAPGYEEVEMLTVVDMLRRASISIDMVSVGDSIDVVSSHNVSVKADLMLKDANFSEADMLILPGGIPGVPNLLACDELTAKLKEAAKAGKWLSAICAGPSVFGELGLLEGKKAICYPGFEEKLLGAEVIKQPVVVSDNFITGRGMGVAIEFAAAIIERFKGKEVTDSVLDKIIYNAEY